MHLYTMSASPNGKRVAIFMKEKGIDIPTTEIDLRAGENLTEEYRRKNPLGRVPVLELDDGTFLSESQAICLYLEGHSTQRPTCSVNPHEERAKIEMWARRVDLNFLMPVAQGFRNLTGYYKDRETCVKEWGEVSALAARDTAVLLDAHLANNQFLLGDRYAIPDMTLAIVMGFAKNVGQDFFDLPNLSRFYADVTARAAFQ